MLRLFIFIIIAILGVVAMVALFAVGSESWNGERPYKIEQGFFPYWQTVDDGDLPAKSTSQLLYVGLLETSLACAVISFIIYVAWRGLVGKTFEQKPSAEHGDIDPSNI